jgi:phosphoribosylanthranilate isomerase
MRVKVCGLRGTTDLQVALAAGVDAVGVILGARHRTEDEVSVDVAAALVDALPPFVSSVMVTHLQQADAILPIFRRVAPSTLQLQDTLSPRELGALRAGLPGIKLIQAVHVVDPSAVAEALAIEPLVDAVLLDSRTADRIGGTGVPHDWSLSRQIVQRARKPVILAGGLTADNLTAALAAVGPAAVDVNSGVEDREGQKDPARLRAFVSICRSHQVSALA